MEAHEFEHTVQKIFEGIATDEEIAHVQQCLHFSEEYREIYCKSARLHALLTSRAKGLQSLSTPTPIIPLKLIKKEQRKKTMWIASVAALLIISFLTVQLFFIKADVPDLTFRAASYSDYKITHSKDLDEPPVGNKLTKGSRLQIFQGSVELTFGTGVTSIVNGPADLTLMDDNILALNKGEAWFTVPEKAKGFQVITKQLEITDLGTEFGVIAHPESSDQVHLIRGKVEVKSKSQTSKTIALTPGKALTLSETGELTFTPFAGQSFATQLTKTLPYIHWSFDGTGKSKITHKSNIASLTSEKTKTSKQDSSQAYLSVAGKFGNALKRHKDGGYIESTWRGISGNEPRTIAYWIRVSPDKMLMHPIAGWGERNEDGKNKRTAFFSYINSREEENKTVSAISIGAYWITGKTNIADDKWHHIAATYTGKTDYYGRPELKLYVDGKLEDLKIHDHTSSGHTIKALPLSTQTSSSNAVPLRMFDHLWKTKKEDYSISPEIDELYIIHGSLTVDQVRQLYLENKL